MTHSIVTPHSFMKKFPLHESEVVSEVWFGEPITLSNSSFDWVEITSSDRYKGWIEKRIIAPIQKGKSTRYISSIKAPVYKTPLFRYEPIYFLPAGAVIQITESPTIGWYKIEGPEEGYIQEGHTSSLFENLSYSEALLWGEQLCGIPYIWGGRTTFGFDCSGLVQTVLRRAGIQIPRDAKDQIHSSVLNAIPFKNASRGNIIFFGKDSTDIQHVGMMLSTTTFLHASIQENRPYVRISSIFDPTWSGSDCSIYPFRSIYAIQNLFYQSTPLFS